MANKRWIGKAQPITQVDTIAVAGTWTAGDTVTLTINTKSLVLTVGTDDATTEVATAIAEMINGEDQSGTGDHTFSETGPNVPEFAELSATVSGSVVTITGVTKGKPFTLSVTEATAGDGTATEATATAATGPNHWNNINNWDAGAVPVSGVNEIQIVDLDSGSANNGTFTLTFNGQTTGNIAWDATAAQVKTALEALSTIDPDEVSVTGTDITSTGYTVTFQNGLGYQDVPQMTVDDALLTGTTPVAQVTTSQAGSTGDDVFLDNSNISILYALSQSAIALNSLNVAASFTGSIGLPKTNADGAEYIEYRADYLAIGATTLNIGLGRGRGSGRIKINLGTMMSTVNIMSSGSSDETDIPAILIKGTNAYNTINIRGNSDFGSAIYGGETSTWSSVDISGSGQAWFGQGTTVTTVEINGFTVWLDNGATTVNMFGGEVTVEAGSVTTLNCRGGTFVWNSIATLGTGLVAESGVLDFSQDPRPKTVTNPIELYGSGAQVLDPESVVSNLRVDFNEASSSAQIDWGRNVRLTRSAVS